MLPDDEVEYQNAKKAYEEAFAKFIDDPLQIQLNIALGENRNNESEKLFAELVEKYNICKLRNNFIRARNALLKKAV